MAVKEFLENRNLGKVENKTFPSEFANSYLVSQAPLFQIIDYTYCIIPINSSISS